VDFSQSIINQLNWISQSIQSNQDEHIKRITINYDMQQHRVNGTRGEEKEKRREAEEKD